MKMEAKEVQGAPSVKKKKLRPKQHVEIIMVTVSLVLFGCISLCFIDLVSFMDGYFQIENRLSVLISVGCLDKDHSCNHRLYK